MKLFTFKPKEYRYILKLDKYDCNILIRALDDYRNKSGVPTEKFYDITTIIKKLL